MKIVILGSSLTWGGTHAAAFRSLIKGLYKRGHKILFLERDNPRYANNRDFSPSYYCNIKLYKSLSELKEQYQKIIGIADLAIVGSGIPQGAETGDWVLQHARGVKVFYDLDTPSTLENIEKNNYEYVHPGQIPKYDMYLTSSGGQILNIISNRYGSPNVRPLYYSVDPDIFYPEKNQKKWDLGYMGAYNEALKPRLTEMLTDVAGIFKKGKFVIAGPAYPETFELPVNVERIEHLSPISYRLFYSKQRFGLNITRHEMVSMGHAPGIKLLEAAACAVPVISDFWDGIEDFFQIGHEILIARTAFDVIEYLKNMPDEERIRIGQNARKRVLNAHTGETRAVELELYVMGFQVKNMVV